MKLKYILIFVLTIGLCACPSPDDTTYFEISSISVSNVIADTGEKLENNALVKWNTFALDLSFSTNELADIVNIYSQNTAIAAPYALPIPNTKIISLRVEYRNSTDRFNVSELLSTFQFRELCEKKIDCLNHMASIQYNSNIMAKHYLKFNSEPEIDLSDGYFITDFELENGTILRDSTQIITIQP